MIANWNWKVLSFAIAFYRANIRSPFKDCVTQLAKHDLKFYIGQLNCSKRFLDDHMCPFNGADLLDY